MTPTNRRKRIEEIVKIAREPTIKEDVKRMALDSEVIQAIDSLIDEETAILRSDLASALGHMEGCGHPYKYLTEKYKDLITEGKEKDE